MPKQLPLFGDAPHSDRTYGIPMPAECPSACSEPVELCDHTVTEEEKPRLAGQCAEILELLRQGPQSNTRLAQVALNYRARISDLRKTGINIVCVNRNYKTGLSYYEIQPKDLHV